MNRPWQVWSSFAVCLLIVLVAMSWLTQRSLALDRAEALARRQLQQEIDIKLAVLRMDAALTPLLAQEAARPFASASTNSVHSLPPHVLLNFRSVNGNWSSPQVPDVTANAQAIVPQQASLPQQAVVGDDGELARTRLDQLDRSIDVRRLLELLPGQSHPHVSRLAMQTEYRLDQQDSEANSSLYGRERDAQLRQKSTVKTGMQSKSQRSTLNPNQLELQRVATQGRQELAARNRVLQTLTQSASHQFQQAADDSLFAGDSRALWLNDRLLYVRRVEAKGVAGVSGSWLDWPEIKRLLLEQVADLVPDADLIRVNEEVLDQAFQPGRALAALPAQLVMPEPRIESMPWTPIRVSLLVVWLCLALAATAIGGLLLGIVRLSERRAAFVAAVTHELRTPLTTFKMYSEMLADGMIESPARAQAYLETLTSESDRLIHLVENVLSYARLERGRRVGKRIETSAGTVLERSRPSLEKRSQEANVPLVLSADAESRQATLTTDPAAVEQILLNLVDNACKYGRNGTNDKIQMTLGSNEQSVTFLIQDNGPGVSAKARKDLFRPFSKSVEDAAQTAPGVGLGLALCQRLARDLGGTLQLQDSDHGAAFLLSLPRRSK